MVTPFVSILIDEWAIGHPMSVYMYIFIGVTFGILSYFLYDIWHAIIKIDVLKKEKKAAEYVILRMEAAGEWSAPSADNPVVVAALDPFAPFATEYAAFAERLRVLVPSITGSEEKICILIRAKKRNKEIARILDIDENSVYTQRYRIKRKLPLPEDMGMDEWIREVE